MFWGGGVLGSAWGCFAGNFVVSDKESGGKNGLKKINKTRIDKVIYVLFLYFSYYFCCFLCFFRMFLMFSMFFPIIFSLLFCIDFVAMFCRFSTFRGEKLILAKSTFSL